MDRLRSNCHASECSALYSMRVQLTEYPSHLLPVRHQKSICLENLIIPSNINDTKSLIKYMQT